MLSNKEYLIELSGNKLKARAAGKSLGYEVLDRLIDGLMSAREVLQEQHEKEIKEQQAKKQKTKDLMDLIKAEGMSLEELIQISGTKINLESDPSATKTKIKKQSKPVDNKYKIKSNGEEHLWTGRGRPPKPFADYLSIEGNKKEDLLI